MSRYSLTTIDHTSFCLVVMHSGLEIVNSQNFVL